MAGTLVLVDASTDGARYENGAWFKEIQEIIPGDIVLSYNESTHTVEPKRVVQTFVRQTDRIYHVRYSNGAEFETTFNHEFYVKGEGWVQAKQLRPGDVSITANGAEQTIAGVNGEARYETVYNFEVQDNHTYFVGRDTVLVHNQTYVPPAAAPDLLCGISRIVGRVENGCDNPEYMAQLRAAGMARGLGELAGSIAGGVGVVTLATCFEGGCAAAYTTWLQSHVEVTAFFVSLLGGDAYLNGSGAVTAEEAALIRQKLLSADSRMLGQLWKRLLIAGRSAQSSSEVGIINNLRGRVFEAAALKALGASPNTSEALFGNTRRGGRTCYSGLS
ncbi:MAG: HINT domain-containing protein [Leptospirales bacterium]|nr:HINT domain-containing protein [Leptospirales bacterium]